MAKYECSLQGDFKGFLNIIEDGILGGSISATLEDRSDYSTENFTCAVRVFERYSMIGENRVSLSVTLLSHDDVMFLSAIASGGSQAVFLKFNTFGEETFLDKLIQIVEDYKRQNND